MTNKYRPNDPRGFDAEKSNQATKDYHSYKADEEVARLVARYKDAPQFLRLLALKLNEVSTELHAKHVRDNTKPKRDGQGRFQSDAFEDDYSPDGTYRG